MDRAARLLEDAFVASQIDDAMSAVAEALAPADRMWMRHRLAELLVEDPQAAAVLDGAHPRSVQHSGRQLRLGAEGPGAVGLGDEAAEG